jgi:hypothetical protein
MMKSAGEREGKVSGARGEKDLVLKLVKTKESLEQNLSRSESRSGRRLTNYYFHLFFS